MIKQLTLALILALSLTFISPSLARSQKSPRPKGQISVAEILSRHISASGGADALLSLQTLDADGSFYISTHHRLGDFHFYYKAPASDVFRLEAVSHGQSSIGHSDGEPFRDHTVRGIGGFNGITIDILERNWLGLIESGFDQAHYTQIELVGITEIDGSWAYALRFAPAVGDRQVRYYDCESFLMVRMDLAQRIRQSEDGPESAYKVETRYSDYRVSDGLYLPRKIRAIASAGDVVFEVNQLRTNTPVSDSVFRKN
jgi:hypothetical protein